MKLRNISHQRSLFVFILSTLVANCVAFYARGADVTGDLEPFFHRYCADCHGEDQVEANIDLDRLAADDDLVGDFKSWEKVAEVLRTSRMPPAESAQPNEAERRGLAELIRGTLEDAIEQNAGDPGHIAMKRLTSAEYGYTIRDLTELDLRLERAFVNDAVGGEGFTNAGGAQFMQDSSLEIYLEAAKRVAEHAVIGAGPLRFFTDPGQTGRELSAIDRIKRLYRKHGFRTAAGEGASPFGLDLYPRAFLVAWRYLHRERLNKTDVPLEKLALEEGLSPRFCAHVWSVLNGHAKHFPTSVIDAQWRNLPPPDSLQSRREPRDDCERIAQTLREWQKLLAAASGDEEEASVLTAGELHLKTHHDFNANLSWKEGSKTAEIELSVTSASPTSVRDALIIWRNPRLRFRATDGLRGEDEPLVSYLDPQTVERLAFGKHPIAAASIGKNDFVLSGETTAVLHIRIPEGKSSARLAVEVELDVVHAAGRIVRCRMADHSAEGKTAAAVGATSTLLGDPASKVVGQWQLGVSEFARLLPEVSHREPAPSDRDPIPWPYDNTYNLPERNHFHTAIKYHRDDQFLVEHILDDVTRHELDDAWTDLLTSFDYHNLNLQFALKKWEIELAGNQIASLDREAVARLPDEPRQFLVRLRDEFFAMQSQLELAQPGHVSDAIRMAQRAWRRPLTADEQQRLRDFYRTLRDDDELDHVKAMRSLITRIFVSPAFLYLAEPTAGSTGVVPLADYELASRLSYFLWSSLPDDELLKAALDGELRSAAGLTAQTRRMLSDPKARRLATEFFGQWFGFYRFDEYRGIDSQRFPEFDEALRSSMYEEAISFFEYLVREDRPVREILFADYTFLNQTLARHYDLDSTDLPADGLLRVANVNKHHRGGLLGLGVVHAVTSAPLRTSPVKRGDWVLRRIVGSPVPPPPADAGSIAADDVLTDGLTIRSRLEAHRQDASCSSCHTRIDPLGFALENYDPIGRWRNRYRDGQAIDTSGKLSDGTEITGLDSLLAYLRREQGQFHRNLSGKLLGYALGRAELATDRPLIEEMLASVRENGSFSELIVRIVNSRQFRNSRS